MISIKIAYDIILMKLEDDLYKTHKIHFMIDENFAKKIQNDEEYWTSILIENQPIDIELQKVIEKNRTLKSRFKRYEDYLKKHHPELFVEFETRNVRMSFFDKIPEDYYIFMLALGFLLFYFFYPFLRNLIFKFIL